jgi:PPOX class probable F420-dependent enzyme
MKYFEKEQLQLLAQTKEVVIETRLSSQARSRQTPIWVIVEENNVYVRSYRGQAGRWYQEIIAFPFAALHVNGEQLAVRAVPVTDEATISRVSHALLQKYPTSSYARPMVQDEIVGTTLRLEPASPLSAANLEEREETTDLLSSEERTFLLSGTRTGKLATVRADGRPHIVPVAFDLDGDTIIILVMHTSVKARNMQRDPRVCLCVDVETPPYAYIQIEGIVEMSADLSALAYWGKRIVSRYDGIERAEAYIKREGLMQERVVRLTPTKILFRKNIGGGK